MSKVALITGITGQDGSYLAEFLLHKGYEVHGLIRRSSSINTQRLDTIYADPHIASTRLFLHYGDLTAATELSRLFDKVRPCEVYNLGAQSHVRVSFDTPVHTGDVTGLGLIRIAETIRSLKLDCKLYQAGSSEMFGGIQGEVFLNEETPFHPRSPYGCAKVYAHWSAVNYREAYGMFISNGILFNHESPRRGFTFVTRKISRYVAALANGTTDEKLYMGNLDAKRDWGYSPEYVVAMWKMLQQDKPADYVIATGMTHSVREFLVKAFESIGKNWEDFVEIDQRYFRPSEVHHLLGDARKAKTNLDWQASTSFQHLVGIMVEADRTGQETGLKEIWESA
jgi:GDPmannose 4,6-dehydratase